MATLDGANATAEPIYLSSLAFAHGTKHRIDDLPETSTSGLTGEGQGMEFYRRSDLAPSELAASPTSKTLEVTEQRPDLVIYVSDTDRRGPESVARLLRTTGIPAVSFAIVSGHACGNLGPALALAADALLDDRCQQVLLVSVDVLGSGNRSMRSGLSIFSDAASSCMVTATEPIGGGPVFKLSNTSSTSNQAFDAADSAQMLRGTVELGRQAIDELLDASGTTRDDYTGVAFANYRLPSQRFLCSVIGIDADRLIEGRVADDAHCFATDLLVNLLDGAVTGSISEGDRLLVSATGPHVWTMFDVQACRMVQAAADRPT